MIQGLFCFLFFSKNLYVQSIMSLRTVDPKTTGTFLVTEWKHACLTLTTFKYFTTLISIFTHFQVLSYLWIYLKEKKVSSYEMKKWWVIKFFWEIFLQVNLHPDTFYLSIFFYHTPCWWMQFQYFAPSQFTMWTGRAECNERFCSSIVGLVRT